MNPNCTTVELKRSTLKALVSLKQAWGLRSIDSVVVRLLSPKGEEAHE